MPSIGKRLFSRKKKLSAELLPTPVSGLPGVNEEFSTPGTSDWGGLDALTPRSRDAGPLEQRAESDEVSGSSVAASPSIEKPVPSKEIGMTATTAEKRDVKDDIADPPKYNIHAEQVLYLLGVFGLLVALATLKVLHFGFWKLTFLVAAGFAGGLGLSLAYLESKRRKEATSEMLHLNPGVKGLVALMGSPPSWLSYREKEKVEWLNKMLNQMWPFYDKAICDNIKELVEPVMEDCRPPIFKFIGFKKITFGDVPFRVEGVRVEEEEDEVVMYVDLRWCGDSNITLSIEPNLPGDVTRMAPTINQISLVGTIRIMFKPLLATPPCFGAVVVSLLKPPMMKFKIDVGKALGGSAIGNTVKKSLYPFINETLMNMLVWPQRYVVPMMLEEHTGPLDHLELRSVGLLAVKIVQAKDLPAADMGGSSDPVVEVYTESTRKFKTKTIKQNLNPQWNEDPKYLFVQEPRSQYVRVNVYDVDVFNARNLVKGFNVIKNIKESVGAEELLGRAQVLIQNIAKNSGSIVDQWYDLGMGEWAADNGPGSGCGQVRLRMIYQPFSALKPSSSSHGALIVKVIRCRNLVAMDASGTSDPYIKLKLKGISHQTHVMKQNLNPEFHLTYEWYDVVIDDELKIKVFDKDIGPQSDDFMGELYLLVSDIAKAIDSQGNRGKMKKWFELEDIDHGELELSLQFIPFPNLEDVL